MHPFSDQPASSPAVQARREWVFLILAGLFLGSLTMLNILGISRFIKLFEHGELTFAVAVGVIPYPITFLCTDLIGELYGKKHADRVVWIGLILNFWVISVLWIGGILPGFEALDPQTGEILRDAAGRLPVFLEVRALTFGAVLASMAAYLAAQFVDVYLFHALKDWTRGKHLWLRNNVSTLTSQMVDTVCVILITHFLVNGLKGVLKPEDPLWPQLWTLIFTGYAFKAVCALLDTFPFYWATGYLRRTLELRDEYEDAPPPPKPESTPS